MKIKKDFDDKMNYFWGIYLKQLDKRLFTNCYKYKENCYAIKLNTMSDSFFIYMYEENKKSMGKCKIFISMASYNSSSKLQLL